MKKITRPNKEMIRCGGYNDNENQVILRSGSLSMIYENGNLRHIMTGGHELIRMIYLAVRDREWLTIKPAMSDERIDTRTSSFSISYFFTFNEGDIRFSAFMNIEGRNDSSVCFSMKGKALNSFEKNRIGFCVLHPINGLAGKSCTIIHPDQGKEESAFPELISPHQPFRNIAGMKWSAGATKCSLEFKGDIFETEDQRNWTDASFKTYSTPLSLPFPVRVEKGWTASQEIFFKAESGETISNARKEIIIELKPGETKKFPSIGIGRSSRPQPLTANEIRILKSIGFDHYRSDLYLFDEGWKNTAALALKESQKLGYPVAFALFFSGDCQEELKSFISWQKQNKPAPSALMIFHKDHDHTPAKLADAVIPVLKDILPGTSMICGTNANFAQLSRNKPSSKSCAGICWSIHPQEHASDNLTLIENLEGQGHTVMSAKAFCEGKTLWVSPVNLVRRFNANLENFETAQKDGAMPPQVDRRIISLFGAGWTAGSIKYLSEAGADNVTYFETAGERGIMQGDYPPQWPGFPSQKGMIFPAYFLFRYLSQKNPSIVIKSISSDPLVADSLVFSDGKNISGVIFNLSSFEQTIKLEGVTGRLKMVILDSRSFLGAVSDSDWLSGKGKITLHEKKLNLPPFSLSFVEF